MKSVEWNHYKSSCKWSNEQNDEEKSLSDEIKGARCMADEQITETTGM